MGWRLCRSGVSVLLPNTQAIGKVCLSDSELYPKEPALRASSNNALTAGARLAAPAVCLYLAVW